MAGVFERINRALSKKNEGVERRAQTEDEALRKKREEERIARARAARLKQMGIK